MFNLILSFVSLILLTALLSSTIPASLSADSALTHTIYGVRPLGGLCRPNSILSNLSPEKRHVKCLFFYPSCPAELHSLILKEAGLSKLVGCLSRLGLPELIIDEFLQSSESTRTVNNDGFTRD